VLVTLHHPTTDATVWSSRSVGDLFKYTAASTGQYKLCFKQTSSRARQTASFQVHTQSDYGGYFEDAASTLASKSQAEKLTIISSQIENKIHDLLDQQDYAITREAMHRYSQEETSSRMFFWSMAQILVLTSISVIQLFYLKRTFEIKLIA